MKILKASAGSGKTYSLSKTYQDLVLNNPDPHHYRHILAVTFTNKATAEMKSRILNDLYRLSKTDSRAKDLLTDILHDYGAFSVSTIDKFFQQALRAFSREIGQFADYQVELDKNALIRESVRRIIDNLTENSGDVLHWICENSMARLAEGSKPNIEDSLVETALTLKKEEHTRLMEEYGLNDVEHYNKPRLAALRKACDGVVKDFMAGLRDLGVEADPHSRFEIPSNRFLKAHPGLEEYLDENYDRYNTVFIIRKDIYSLGLAGEFFAEYETVMKERNILCLDDSNTILRDIINGSDAPFVYEKIGVRYEDFLLDEFQDTSEVQWANFKPLLEESEAKGGKNLVVGDIKQSIYRWRDSDWHLLGSTVLEEFPSAEVETLGYNWRSCRCIVDFNNRFFNELSGMLGIGQVYADVAQGPRSDDAQEGCVRLTFTDEQLEAVRESVQDARKAGAEWEDIAILVRNNKQGEEIAAYLIDKNTPVISEDSLHLSSSVTIRRLVSLLNAYLNPDESLNQAIVSDLKIEFPENYQSLSGFCEALLASLRAVSPEVFDGELPFIQAFMDDVLEWSASYGNNLRSYLDRLDLSGMCISSPDDTKAIRILTIHKSKGLEFPYVIFPYADKVPVYDTRSSTHWCYLDASSHGLESCFTGVYPVSMSSHVQRSFFADDYQTERDSQLIDNVNVFYVALTRAVKSLHIISAPVAKKVQAAVASGKMTGFTKLSHYLYAFGGGKDDVSFGTPYDFTAMVRKSVRDDEPMPGIFDIIPTGERLKTSAEASDFFSEEDKDDSPRMRGVVLHDILSHVVSLADIAPAVESAVTSGLLDASAREEVEDLLTSRVAAHPEWFPADGTRILREQTILGADGKEHRPDRVVVEEDGVTVIDFKFGEPHGSYIPQVRRYASLLKQLGYKVKAGVVWYVKEDKTENI